MSAASKGVFNALAISIRPLYDVLKCIAFQPLAQVRISQEGLRISVEESRSLQAHAFLERNLFSAYNFHNGNESITFGISLTALMELLSIYIPNVSYPNLFGRDSIAANPLRIGGTLRISHTGDGGPLVLTLEEGGVITNCELTTYEPDELADIDIGQDPPPSKIIMKSEWLWDAITELEASSGELLSIRESPRAPYFRLATQGMMGSAQMDYPNDRSVLETFNCPDDIRHSYKFSMIRNSLKAMNQASKVSVRIDHEGILSMQFMISVGEGKHSFVDFRLLPSVDDDERGEQDTFAF